MNQFQSGIWAGALGGSLALDVPIARYYAADAVVDGGGKVTMWPPRFGNPLNVLSTPDPAKRPGFNPTGGFGAGPCLTFDGAHGIGTDAFYLPPLVTDIAILCVVRIRGATTSNFIIQFGSNGTGPINGTGGVGLTYAYIQTTGNVGVNRMRYPGFTLSLLNKWMRMGGMGYLSDPAPETITYRNGIAGTTNTVNNADNTSYFNSVTIVRVGTSTYFNDFLVGDITEIHIYPRLTTAQFLDLDAQVAATYPPFP